MGFLFYRNRYRVERQASPTAGFRASRLEAGGYCQPPVGRIPPSAGFNSWQASKSLTLLSGPGRQ